MPLTVLYPSKVLGVATAKLFCLASVGMAAGTVEAVIHPTPLQSWAVILGAVATSLTAVTALLGRKWHNESRGTRRRKPVAIRRRKPTKSDDT